MNSKLGRWTLAVLAHVALFAAWYLFVRFGEVPKFVMPSPGATLDALLQPNYDWWANIAVTGTEIFVGYLIALVVGVALALLFSWSKTLEAFFMPLFVSLNMIPKVALGPLIIVWFKYGVFPNSIMAFSIAVFPILLDRAGLARDRARAPRPGALAEGVALAALAKIQLPGALPTSSPAWVGAILAVAGAIVGEFLGSDQGLGCLMLQVQVTLDTPAMFMAVPSSPPSAWCSTAWCSSSSDCSSSRTREWLDPARVGVGEDLRRLHRLLRLVVGERHVDRALHQPFLHPAQTFARALGHAEIHDLRRGVEERLAVESRHRRDHRVDCLGLDSHARRANPCAWRAGSAGSASDSSARARC